MIGTEGWKEERSVELNKMLCGLFFGKFSEVLLKKRQFFGNFNKYFTKFYFAIESSNFTSTQAPEKAILTDSESKSCRK